MRDMTFADRASNATIAARHMRDTQIRMHHREYLRQNVAANLRMPNHPDEIDFGVIESCRVALWKCEEALDELERLIDKNDTSDSAWGMFPE
jgi:hypothetical protein